MSRPAVPKFNKNSHHFKYNPQLKKQEKILEKAKVKKSYQRVLKRAPQSTGESFYDKFFSGAIDERDHEREVTRFKAISHAEEADKRASSQKKKASASGRPAAAGEEDVPPISVGEGDEDEVAETASCDDLAHKDDNADIHLSHAEKTDVKHHSQSSSTKTRKPDPFSKQRRDFETKQQAEIDLAKEHREQKKKLRVARYNRFKKKAAHMHRTPKGQPIMRNVLANLMAKYEK